jgi:hypothetical protein
VFWWIASFAIIFAGRLALVGSQPTGIWMSGNSASLYVGGGIQKYSFRGPEIGESEMIHTASLGLFVAVIRDTGPGTMECIGI